MNTDKRTLLEALEAKLPAQTARDPDLAPIVRWKVGGRAAALVEPADKEQVAAVYRLARDTDLPLFLMGDASNLLFDSQGFSGIIMRIGHAMSEVRFEGNSVYAQAGVWIPKLARMVGNAGLSGMEHTIGIPGTLGGLILMNGGSQRKGIGSSVLSVECVDRNGNLFEMDQEACGFAYRKSNLQDMDCAIVSARLQFSARERMESIREMLGIMVSRKTRFPKNLPNGGSTFLSDPALYATLGPPGAVIEKLGLKGVVHGGAQISPQHANFIVNNGGASSDDILFLIHLIRKRTREETGFLMDCEVRFVNYDGRVLPAHIAAEERFGVIP